MSVTDEELSAFLDGELPPAERRRIIALIAADPELQRRIERMGAVDRDLLAAFAEGEADAAGVSRPLIAAFPRPSARRWLVRGALAAIAAIVAARLFADGAPDRDARPEISGEP